MKSRATGQSATVSVSLQTGPQSVSSAAKIPLYQQIYLILRDQIVSGSYKAGDILPSELELGQTYGVSRITAKQALSELAAVGLASRFRGRGTVVNETQVLPPLRAHVADWMNFATTMGRRTRVKVIEMITGSATAEECAALDLPEATQVCRWLRVRHLKGEPFSVLRVTVPADLGGDITKADLESTPLLDLIAARGRAIGEARQVVTATLADQFLASQLGVDVGSPILKLIRIVQDTNGKAIEYLTAFYRPDRYQLEMVLSANDKHVRLGEFSRDVFEPESANQVTSAQGRAAPAAGLKSKPRS